MKQRVTDKLSNDARTVVAILGNRDTYRNVRNRVISAFHALVAVLGNRDTYATVGRTIRSGATVLTTRDTYVTAWNHGADAYRSTRAVLGNRDTYANAYRATRAAVTDPATTWRNLSHATATAAAGARSTMTRAHMWRAAATLGVAAILSLGILGLNAPNPAPTSNVTVADAADTGNADRADRSTDRTAAEDAPDQAKADDKGAPKTQDAEKVEKKADPKPVAGLNKTQMANAVTVVEVGQKMGISKRGQAVALVTAMQETKFHNYASSVLPESQNYPFDKIGSDHDSVGIFQQRPSMGWGSVKQCMDPAYAAKAFYKALKRVHGWEDMPLTVAAQTVQGSAFPDAYAQWEGTANAILDEMY